MSKDANFKRIGDVITYAAGAAHDVGDVVALGTGHIGICTTDIASGATGSLAITGVWELPANNNLEISVGDAVYWDVADNEINKTAQDNVAAGWAVGAKGAAGTTVLVKIG